MTKVNNIFSGKIDGNERQNVFRKVWGRFDFDNKEQEQFFQNQRKDMEKLLSAFVQSPGALIRHGLSCRRARRSHPAPSQASL